MVPRDPARVGLAHPVAKDSFLEERRVLEQVVQMVDLDAGEIVVDWAVDWDSDT